jgi:NAD(P)-dependent dehydrogenase (short-subunit alcohol dehydrogenase family)
MKNLRDKITVVTGAASGIGQATALEFAAAGADVVVSDVNETGLAETVSAIEAKGRKAVALGVDVSKPDQVEAMIAKAIETFGRIDILMNNAGVGLSGEMRHLSLQDWEWIVGINLWGPIYGIHFALPHLLKQKSGHIVNVASSAGLIASPGMSAYTTTKFGLVGLSEVLRNELARFGIGVTVVCPGFVRTNIFQTGKMKGMKEEAEARRNLPSWLGISKETCARDILRAVQKNRFLIIPGPEMKVVYTFKRFAPFLYQGFNKMMGKQMERWSVD